MTGGLGFVGSHLTEALLSDPQNKITVIDSLISDSSSRENMRPGVRYWIDDIRNLNLTNRLIRKCKNLGREQRKRYIELGKYCEECNAEDLTDSDEEKEKESVGVNIVIKQKAEPTPAPAPVCVPCEPTKAQEPPPAPEKKKRVTKKVESTEKTENTEEKKKRAPRKPKENK